MLRVRPDGLSLALAATVVLATVFPAPADLSSSLAALTKGLIGLVFFLQGARLLPATVVTGLVQWRFHVASLACTFALFPLVALTLWLLVPQVLAPDLFAGFLLLSVVPTTMQSSTTFTAIAGGNVPAALCSASLSNILGVAITPILIGVLLSARSSMDLSAMEAVVLQLLAPFVAGQALQRYLGNTLRKHRRIVGVVDRFSIVMVVYIAFSNAVKGDIWSRLSAWDFSVLVAVALVLLGVMLVLPQVLARGLGYGRGDEIALLFCGSTKSLASGMPMATVILGSQALGVLILPMMVYHQLQLIVCAWLASRYARLIATEPTVEQVHDRANA